MKSIIIYGAGSIGNHLAYACRNKNWQVTITDIDPNALERTKADIYPQRYGNWDNEIRLEPLNGPILHEQCDLVIIGTPPDTHVELALDIMRNVPPKLMLIEKPLCTPGLERCQELIDLSKKTGTRIMVGYNHTLTEHTKQAQLLLCNNIVGKPLYMYAAFREHWAGIFKAHRWLRGPQDTYLGFTPRGGGASGEHSHAINIWQHFAHLLDMGRVAEVSAMLDFEKTELYAYDKVMQINMRTEKGLTGHVVQDVVTKPPKKELNIQGTDGMLEWFVNWDSTHDALIYKSKDEQNKQELFPKKRPDDFKGEIDHIEDVLSGAVVDSPISIDRGLETMLVLAAAHLSNEKRKTVYIDYDKGYSLKALKQTPTL